MADVANLADRIIVMDRGKMVMTGSPQEVFGQKDKLSEIGLGVPPVTQLMHDICEAGVDVPTDVLSIEEAKDVLYNRLSRARA